MDVYTIIGVVIVTIIILYLINKWLYKKKTEYYEQSYWEMRYSWLQGRYMDWYVNYDKANEDFKIEEILKSNFPNIKKSKLKVLELGCGSSNMCFDLYDNGYTNYTAIDYSKNAIEQLLERKNNKNINFLVADYLKLDQTFDSNEFDIVIEKAGLDSITTSDSPAVPDLLYKAYEQVHSILKKNGIFISISGKNPEYWKSQVLNKVEGKIFNIQQIKRSVYKIKATSDNFNYYFYCSKNIK